MAYIFLSICRSTIIHFLIVTQETKQITEMTRKPRNNHAKLELVFDTKQRQEFLTGFSKRKQARKKAAHDKLQQQYKDEVARIKKDKRERIKRRLEEVASVKEAEGIDLAQLARNELDKEKVLDLPQHVVTITSTEELDLTKLKENTFLGHSADNSVEVVEVSAENEESNDDKPAAKESSQGRSKSSQKKSKSKVAELARKAQSLKSKRRHRNNIISGRISKSQKKFLKKKKTGRRKDKPSR